MRIAFILPKPNIGGAEKTTALLANRMAHSGHVVYVIALCSKSYEWKIQLSDSVMRVPIGSDILSIFRLLLLLAQEKFDIVFSSFLDINLILLACRPLLRRTKIAIRDALPINFSYPLTRAPLLTLWLAKHLYKYADANITQTYEMADLNRKYLGYEKNTFVIGNPIGNTPPQPKTKNYVTPKTFIAIGRLSEQKGFLSLIDAFCRSKTTNRDIKLLIVGDGEQKELIEKRIESQQASEYIKLVPKQKDLSHYYANSDVYVLSSKYEGLCNTVLEAMAHGIPIVASTQNTAMGEISTHLEDGILVKNNSVESLSEGINSIIKNYGKIDKKSVRQRILQKFNTDKILDCYELLFTSLLKDENKKMRLKN